VRNEIAWYIHIGKAGYVKYCVIEKAKARNDVTFGVAKVKRGALAGESRLWYCNAKESTMTAFQDTRDGVQFSEQAL
jgi:hypothetical protein